MGDYKKFIADDVLPNDLFYFENFSILDFLVKYDNFLKDYRMPNGLLFDTYLEMKCLENNINAKIILVKMQCEQSLITKYKTVPQQKILNKALGVGKYDDGTTNEIFTGFERQINGAINTFKKHFKQAEVNGIKSIKINYGTEEIKPKNCFTYAIYKYTPHKAGAKLFWQVWRMFFKQDLGIKRC